MSLIELAWLFVAAAFLVVLPCVIVLIWLYYKD